MHNYSIALLFFTWITASTAFPNGAPCEVKDTLLPNPGSHGENKNANSKSPYEVNIRESNGNAATCVAKNTKYSVKLKPIGQKPFRGFIMQSVDKKNEPVGKFEDGDSYKYLCSGETTAITHKSSGKKNEVEAEWSTASAIDGGVHIRMMRNGATVRQLSKDHMWLAFIDSNPRRFSGSFGSSIWEIAHAGPGPIWYLTHPASTLRNNSTGIYSQETCTFFRATVVEEISNYYTGIVSKTLPPC